MRLIDADLLKKNCKCTGKFEDNFKGVDLIELAKVIDAQPTAYDVEKVVAELEEERISAENEMHRLRDGEYALPCQFDRTDIEECIMETMSKAVDIVRKGGVE